MGHTGFEAFFGRPIQCDQQRQRPGSGRTGNANTQCQNHPLVPQAMNQMLMTRPHCIAMTSLLINMLTTMLADRVVTSQFQDTWRRYMLHDGHRQMLCQ